MAFLFFIQDFLYNSGTIIGKKIPRNIIIIKVKYCDVNNNFFLLTKKKETTRTTEPSSFVTWALSPNHYTMISYIDTEKFECIKLTWISFLGITLFSWSLGRCFWLSFLNFNRVFVFLGGFSRFFRLFTKSFLWMLYYYCF